jgi:hypothetical protein
MSLRTRQYSLCFGLALATLNVGCKGRAEDRASVKITREETDLAIEFFGRPIVARSDSMTPTTEWSENDDRDTLLVVVRGDIRQVAEFDIAITVEKIRATEDGEYIVLGVDTVRMLHGDRASLQPARRWADGIVIAELHPSSFAAHLPRGQIPANVLVTVRTEANELRRARLQLLFD